MPVLDAPAPEDAPEALLGGPPIPGGPRANRPASAGLNRFAKAFPPIFPGTRSGAGFSDEGAGEGACSFLSILATGSTFSALVTGSSGSFLAAVSNSLAFGTEVADVSLEEEALNDLVAEVSLECERVPDRERVAALALAKPSGIAFSCGALVLTAMPLPSSFACLKSAFFARIASLNSSFFTYGLGPPVILRPALPLKMLSFNSSGAL